MKAPELSPMLYGDSAHPTLEMGSYLSLKWIKFFVSAKRFSTLILHMKIHLTYQPKRK